MRGLTLGDPALLGAAAGFSPLSLSPALWLDASDAATITSSGGLVSQWNDKSGNGRNFTQGTVSSQPSTGADTQNGRNVLTFFGDDWMTAGDTLDLGTNSFTIYAVVRRNTGVSGTVFGKYKASPDSGSYVLLWESEPTLAYTTAYRAASTTVAVARTSLWTSTGYNVHGSLVNRSAGTITQRVNQSVNGTGTFTADSGTSRNTTVGLYIGGLRNSGDTGFLSGYFLAGQIAEIIMTLSVLSADQQIAVETYLKNKWATP